MCLGWWTSILVLCVTSARVVPVTSLEDTLTQDSLGQSPYKNRHPVIGILAQGSDSDVHVRSSYIYESYVKYIEQAGALVVPVRINETDDYYQTLFRKLNGVVFPGGGVSLLSSGYAKSAQHFFNLSKAANSKGDFFPILGICLGFEELTALVTNDNALVKCDGTNYSLALNFSDGAENSRLFKKLPGSLHEALSKWNITFNNHEWCMSTKVFNDNKRLRDFYRVLSTNVAVDGTEFVSAMEAYDYPYYGTQWHPEKNIYLWSDANVNHSALAVQASQYVADFFIDEARKSAHHFDSIEDLGSSVIANYHPDFEGAPSFHNVYHFNVTQSTDTADTLDVWDWPKFSTLTDLSSAQFLNFLLFLLMLATLLGAVSSLIRYRETSTYRVVPEEATGPPQTWS